MVWLAFALAPTLLVAVLGMQRLEDVLLTDAPHQPRHQTPATIRFDPVRPHRTHESHDAKHRVRQPQTTQTPADTAAAEPATSTTT